jgi:hypothetical protein
MRLLIVKVSNDDKRRLRILFIVHYIQGRDGFASKVGWQASKQYDIIIKMILSEIINVRAYQKQKKVTDSRRPSC